MPRSNNNQQTSGYGFFSRAYQRLAQSIGLKHIEPIRNLPISESQAAVNTVVESILQISSPETHLSSMPGSTQSDTWGSSFFFINRNTPNYSRRNDGRTAALWRWWSEADRQNSEQQLAVPMVPSNASKLDNYPEVVIPDDFKCVISYEIMTNPVYDPKYPQQKFDLHVISLWLNENKIHPCSRTPLSLEDLESDKPLKSRIDNFVNKTLRQQQLSAVLRWFF